MYKYKVELVLEKTKNIDLATEELKEIAEQIKIDKFPEETLKISLISLFPTRVFDFCAQFGRLKSIKVEELNSD